MRRLMMVFSFLVLFTACTDNRNEVESSFSSKGEVNQGCPYNGAIVELKYQSEIPFTEIKDIWTDNGWQIANPEADGHTIVAMISGSFEESEWITTSAYKTKEMTILSIWVNQEVEKNKHDEQVSKGNYYLDKIQVSLDKKYPTTSERTSKINWGCEQD